MKSILDVLQFLRCMQCVEKNCFDIYRVNDHLNYKTFFVIQALNLIVIAAV